MTTTETGRGKRPRMPLAGPYGHPFHPILVTVPIGAWTSSLVLDVGSRMNQDAALAEGALWLIVIGVVGALAAAVFGVMDLSGVRPRTRAFRTGVTHLVLNTAAVVLYAVNAGVRIGADDGPVGAAPFTLSVIALAIVGTSGWLGGRLAYHYGVRVADEETQAAGFR